jgi:hypothetical protein
VVADADPQPAPPTLDAALQNYIRATIDRQPGYRQRIEAAWLELLAAMDAQQRSEENMQTLQVCDEQRQPEDDS